MEAQEDIEAQEEVKVKEKVFSASFVLPVYLHKLSGDDKGE